MSFGNTALGRTRVVVPTYNAGRHLDDLLPALRQQGIAQDTVLLVDSSSTDDTVRRFREFGARVHVIPQAEFDHGGTRSLATRLCANAEFLIFITQDALPAPGAFAKLLEAFADEKVGMAYGRQLPRPAARAIERHARLLNYPPQPSERRSIEDRGRLGIKTVFCSDSFSAYRRSALDGVGGFPSPCFFAEDQIVAAAMLGAGWAMAYCAEAEAVHSHGYSIAQDFKRYFDVGVFHARNAWILEKFGRAEGAGMGFVRSELKYLWAHEPRSIPSAIVRTFAKYLGYRLGRMEAKLSNQQKARLSMAPHFWARSG